MSATLVGTVRGLFATCNLTAGTPPTLTCARGVVGAVRNGAGDYTIQTQDGLTLQSDQGGVAQVTLYGAAPGEAAIEQVDASHFRVRTVDNAGAALDASFGFQIQDVGPA